MPATLTHPRGNVFSLQRMRGHSTLEMTKRDVQLSTADLQAKHSQHAKATAARLATL